MLAGLMTLIRTTIYVLTFAALAVLGTLACCYFFPDAPRAWIAKDPLYEVRHALRDPTTLLFFAGIGGVFGLCLSVVHWWVSQKLIRRYRSRAGCCLTCGYDLRGGHIACPECGSAIVAAVS
jgi:hypothetical protein